MARIKRKGPGIQDFLLPIILNGSNYWKNRGVELIDSRQFKYGNSGYCLGGLKIRDFICGVSDKQNKENLWVMGSCVQFF